MDTIMFVKMFALLVGIPSWWFNGGATWVFQRMRLYMDGRQAVLATFLTYWFIILSVALAPF